MGSQTLSQPLSPAMRALYEADLQNTRQQHEKLKQLVKECVSSDLRILCIETSTGFIPAFPGFEKFHPERQRLLNLIHGGKDIRHVRYSDIFRYLLGFSPDDERFVVWTASEGQPHPDPAQFDALVVTGSQQMVTFLDEDSGHHHTIWMRQIIDFFNAWDHTKCGLFICFGHQIEAYRRGGSIAWMLDEKGNRKREFGVVDITLTPEAHNHPFLKGLTEETIAICATHSQHVVKKSDDALVLGSNSTGDNQIISYGETELSIQNHPELTPASLDAIALLREETMAKEGLPYETVEKLLLSHAKKSYRLGDVIFENFIKAIGRN